MLNMLTGGHGIVTLDGEGFHPGNPVFLVVVKTSTNATLTVENQVKALIDSTLGPVVVDIHGAIHCRATFRDVSSGDQVAFYMTDNTPDANDTTGTLWSTQVTGTL